MTTEELKKQIKSLEIELEKINSLKQKLSRLRTIYQYGGTIRTGLYIEDRKEANVFDRHPMINLAYYLSDKATDNLILLLQEDMKEQIEEVEKQIKELEEIK